MSLGANDVVGCRVLGAKDGALLVEGEILGSLDSDGIELGDTDKWRPPPHTQLFAKLFSFINSN